MEHTPVLYQEVLEYLQPRPGGRYVDGTIGAGGHTAGLLAASAPDGRVLAFDRDPEAIAFARRRLSDFGDRVVFVQASYAAMAEEAPAHGFTAVDGVLLDLGLSSRQLADAERGFSFLQDGPLDMRFDPTAGRPAADLVNNLREAELADILWRYGEVRLSRKLARAIVRERPIRTTAQLAGLIAQETGRRDRIHPATQVFQALRIAVNDELGALEQGLAAAVDLLRPGGRLAVISFHSLEDRLVKQFIRRQSRDCVCPPEQPLCTCDAQAVLRPVTRKVVRPTDEEVAANPRSRSARLRVAERLGT
ncbi:MAG: 16S rRNA (cytosine(1402)-N(4))-methyltransferase RsmH [Chloroflexi bacterium]|nr:16S rRNA (cytosine(1402)-N(4))-methyltransferase RsmH [Chloroflexota bacterium]MCI0575386.1 16S rRNA (cytosine(1402)-N(4))-methyltransferase RsmH [Chloroflexota bacterium]MCI0643847.1 16S rRNA (cytosine(1402)-N(4))-methyltransferase RsmH [Chloroflexota bacterium]MCI0726709.1 16S rRNA (cytosine(1402)-N(4))-methyltransferase RsmH [Chloroflexota bacterium]